ncbi:MAG TPA: hypothetical protein VD694_05710 [Nitrososphaeraceae archaeon]|nr:hypothetical protein [Nitrososphaeraceae archaeon]
MLIIDKTLISSPFAGNVLKQLPKVQPQGLPFPTSNNAIEEYWRQGKYDLLVSRYYPRFEGFKHVIANYYRTRRFKPDIAKYLSRNMS